VTLGFVKTHALAARFKEQEIGTFEHARQTDAVQNDCL
jgi:hypothetical protein